MKLYGVLLFLLCILLPIKYTDSIYSYLPCLTVLFLIFMCVLYLMQLRKGIRFETEADGTSCEKGHDVEFGLKLRNRSWFSCPKAEIELFLSGCTEEEKRISAGMISIAGKSEIEIPIKLRMDHIGVYAVGIRQLRIYDLLGFFSIPVKEKHTLRIVVLPRKVASEEVDLREKLLTENKDAARTAASDGFDYTGVREYVPGDPMKKIHWKISARSTGYMTKLTESSRRNDLTILMDLIPVTALSDHKTSFSMKNSFPDLFDCLVETALSLSQQALRKDVECSMMFLGSEGSMVRYLPKDQEEFEDLVLLLPNRLPQLDLVADWLDGAGILEQESRLDNRSANVILCTSDVTESLTQGLITARQQQRHPELYYIVPYDHNVEQVKDAAARLELLEDYGILSHVIFAEQTNKTA